MLTNEYIRIKPLLTKMYITHYSLYGNIRQINIRKRTATGKFAWISRKLEFSGFGSDPIFSSNFYSNKTTNKYQIGTN